MLDELINLNVKLEAGKETSRKNAVFQSAMVAIAQIFVEFFIPLSLIMIALILKNGGWGGKEFIRLPDFLLALVFLSANSIGKYKLVSTAVIEEKSHTAFTQVLVFLSLVAAILFVYAFVLGERTNSGSLDMLIEGVAALTFIVVLYIRVQSVYRCCFEPIQNDQNLLKVK